MLRNMQLKIIKTTRLLIILLNGRVHRKKKRPSTNWNDFKTINQIKIFIKNDGDILYDILYEINLNFKVFHIPVSLSISVFLSLSLYIYIYIYIYITEFVVGPTRETYIF